MQLQIIATSALLGYTSAATAYGARNKAWPAWESADMITLADVPVAAADVGDSLVGCARSKGVAVLPQKCSDAATCVPVDPGTGMSFYGKAATAIGTWKKCDAARGTAGVEYGCSKAIVATANKTGAWTKLAGDANMTDVLVYNVSVSAGGIGSLNAT